MKTSILALSIAGAIFLGAGCDMPQRTQRSSNPKLDRALEDIRRNTTHWEIKEIPRSPNSNGSDGPAFANDPAAAAAVQEQIEKDDYAAEHHLHGGQASPSGESEHSRSSSESSDGWDNVRGPTPPANVGWQGLDGNRAVPMRVPGATRPRNW